MGQPIIRLPQYIGSNRKYGKSDTHFEHLTGNAHYVNSMV